MDPTVVSTSTGSIAIAYDYSPYLERIASSLESISTSSYFERIASSLESISTSSYFERIADSLESISESLSEIHTITASTGIRTYGAYDWIKPLEMISWYSQGLGPNSVSTSTVNQLVSIISSLTNNVSKFE